jgi:hypothetical protein
MVVRNHDPEKNGFTVKDSIQANKQKLVAHAPDDLLHETNVSLAIPALGPRNFHPLRRSPRYAYFMENCRILL